ncbi:MAG TPA: dTDP-4-dehydrorhamnose 3,5-epimerase family protein [Candidatus Doudnabacteria bacterium]|nr:dTDP-4-dehydrorhamnose 3,5-epimerase family protein [Candidatus Doudnabacteria bacterium]
MTEQDYITETKLSGVFIIERPAHGDARGFFRELYRKADLDSRLGFEFNPVQTNHSRSSINTLRGIHIAPWHKLVTVYRGNVQQVVVDVREDSETFGQYVSIQLGEDNFRSVFVPAGFGNAFAVTSDIADYCYLTTGYWAPGKESYVNFQDPDVNVAWEVKEPVVSEADLKHPSLREVYPAKFN